MVGTNKSSIGNNSKRPANISNINTYFEKGEKCAKFCVGPTISRPGPMLFIVAATAVKFVIKSFSYKEIKNTERINKERNVTKYTFVARMTSCSIGLPSILIFFMLFGWM